MQTPLVVEAFALPSLYGRYACGMALDHLSRSRRRAQNISVSIADLSIKVAPCSRIDGSDWHIPAYNLGGASRSRCASAGQAIVSYQLKSHNWPCSAPKRGVTKTSIISRYGCGPTLDEVGS
jgi:hypothetical protein